MGVIMMAVRWLFSSGLDRILTSIDNKVDNETKRDELRTAAVTAATEAQARVLTGPGWWFPLLFAGPAGFWFGSVCLYSVFFCKNCMYPVSWSIAALPPPLDTWMGVIVSGLFIGGMFSYIKR